MSKGEIALSFQASCTDALNGGFQRRNFGVSNASEKEHWLPTLQATQRQPSATNGSTYREKQQRTKY
ncbi:hypothetical protein EWB00_001822 [Schistosoma japonicum]|uniref:Uncharacterized protein n=1 Tax=Schistosoma japonicum TaxID=6182 RepID=A0A4Z2CJU2_SCHJA|nr:hypothetical protein EWB00_001822 [Schistosoma japonicum]